MLKLFQSIDKIPTLYVTLVASLIAVYKPLEQRREEEVAELLNRSLTLDETAANVVGEEYAVIQLGSGPVLPPRPPAPRGSPLTVDQWAQFQDEEGRVTNVDRVKDIIFRGVSAFVVIIIELADPVNFLPPQNQIIFKIQ